MANNIAEGFERGTTNELLTFLYIARGSAGEVRSMLFHGTTPKISEFQISDFKNLPLKVARANWARGPDQIFAGR